MLFHGFRRHAQGPARGRRRWRLHFQAPPVISISAIRAGDAIKYFRYTFDARGLYVLSPFVTDYYRL